MGSRRFIVAVLSAPMAAAVAFYLSWLTWLLFFMSPNPRAVLADQDAVVGLLHTWPVIVVAIVFAFVLEIFIGLPLLALFRRMGWLSFPAFLVGGCAAAVAFYFTMRGMEPPMNLPVTIVLLLVPGCVGALVFGYIGCATGKIGNRINRQHG